jgi:hypothetical protein
VIGSFTVTIKQFFLGKDDSSTAMRVAIVAAVLTALFTFVFDNVHGWITYRQNKQKVQQIVNAEIFENLTVANEYAQAKNQIVSDVDFVSFIQKDRFYTASLRDLLASNFQYLDNTDLYNLAIARDKMNAFNSKLDILENSKMNKPPISSKPECSFLYFLPEDKLQAHRYLNDDLNRIINSFKKLSFFAGNPYEDLKPFFNLTDGQVGIYNFSYSEEYKDVRVNCQ